MRPIVLTVALCAAAAAAVAAQTPDFSRVEMKVTRVAGNVYMLEGSGGNIGALVGDEGIVMIDDQFAPLAPKIAAALKTVSGKPVRFVVNTHYHFDHTGANANFGQDGSTIVAQDNVRKRLAQGGSTGGNAIQPAPRAALPIVTFNDKATIWLNDEEIRAIHLPSGHTDGDAVIWFVKSNVVHMGDDFVTYGFPFIDVASGGSVSGMIAACEQVLKTVPADTKFIPGHGPISAASDIRAFVQMMEDTRAAVEAEVRRGRTLDQIKAAGVLAKWESLGKAFIKTDQWIETLYGDITKKASGAAGYLDHGHEGERRTTGGERQR